MSIRRGFDGNSPSVREIDVLELSDKIPREKKSIKTLLSAIPNGNPSKHH